MPADKLSKNKALTKQLLIEFEYYSCKDSVASGAIERTCNGLAVFWPTMDLAEI